MEFSAVEKKALAKKIKEYFAKELDQEIGGFEAGFLLDFFTEEIGPYFYNRGLYDAQALLARKMDDLAETIYELEKPTKFSR